MNAAVNAPTPYSPNTPAPPNMLAPMPACLPFSASSALASSTSARTSCVVWSDSSRTSSPIGRSRSSVVPVGPDTCAPPGRVPRRYPYASPPMRTSVVIRVRDEARALGELLDRLARQTAPHEVVVVDSGSADGSDAVAERAGAQLVRVGAFTFGGALNAGTRAASGDVVVALSAHAFPPDERWLARMTGAFEDPAVACAFGPQRGGRRVQEAATFDPRSTYSNGAGGFRRALWERHPFREDLPACE